MAPAVSSVPRLSSFPQCLAILGDSALADLVPAKTLQLLAGTLSVLRMVRRTGGSFSLAPDGFIWYCSLRAGLSDP